MRAPFPWFGGKRRVKHVVWRAFGADVPNYVEPFAGSLAVLFGRPDPAGNVVPFGHPGKIETVNDSSRFLVNFWRAVVAEPEQVAAHADLAGERGRPSRPAHLALRAAARAQTPHACRAGLLRREDRWLVGVGHLPLDRRRLVCGDESRTRPTKASEA
jgi:site-specific DNA-adenine methylase